MKFAIAFVVGSVLVAVAGAEAAQGAYRVRLSGTASGNHFDRSAKLALRKPFAPEGNHKIDVCLRSGVPASQPRVGAIRFGSNAGCFRQGSRLDLTSVRKTRRTITMRPYGDLGGTYANNWTASNSIAGGIYSPVRGKAFFRFSRKGKRVRGFVRLTGYCGPFCGWSTYRARVRRGRLIR